MNKRRRKKEFQKWQESICYQVTTGRWSTLLAAVQNLPKPQDDYCASSQSKMITVVYPGADGIGPDVYEEDV